MTKNQPVGKILIWCPLYPPNTGGLQNHAQEFNIHMAEQGWEILTLTPLITPNTPEEESPKTNIKIIRFPAFEIIPNYPLPKIWKPKFWKALHTAHKFSKSKNTKTIIISRTRFFITSLFALVHNKLTHTPWVHIEHGSDFVHLGKITSLIARIYDYTIGRTVFKNATHLIANSHASAKFIKKISNKKATVIYRGIEEEEISSITPENSLKETCKNKTIITYAGRLVTGKGVRHLLDAVEPLEKNSYQLLIIGNGPEKKNLKEQVKKLNITSNVTFLGDLPWQQVIAILKISHIMANPSYNEGIPTNVIEAMLSSTAVIATNVGGTTELVTNNTTGLLIPPKDTHALKIALRTLSENPKLRHNYTTNALKQIEGKFSWSNATKQYTNILKSL